MYLAMTREVARAKEGRAAYRTANNVVADVVTSSILGTSLLLRASSILN